MSDNRTEQLEALRDAYARGRSEYLTACLDQRPGNTDAGVAAVAALVGIIACDRAIASLREGEAVQTDCGGAEGHATDSRPGTPRIGGSAFPSPPGGSDAPNPGAGVEPGPQSPTPPGLPEAGKLHFLKKNGAGDFRCRDCGRTWTREDLASGAPALTNDCPTPPGLPPRPVKPYALDADINRAHADALTLHDQLREALGELSKKHAEWNNLYHEIADRADTAEADAKKFRELWDIASEHRADIMQQAKAAEAERDALRAEVEGMTDDLEAAKAEAESLRFWADIGKALDALQAKKAKLLASPAPAREPDAVWKLRKDGSGFRVATERNGESVPTLTLIGELKDLLGNRDSVTLAVFAEPKP